MRRLLVRWGSGWRIGRGSDARRGPRPRSASRPIRDLVGWTGCGARTATGCSGRRGRALVRRARDRRSARARAGGSSSSRRAAASRWRQNASFSAKVRSSSPAVSSSSSSCERRASPPVGQAVGLAGAAGRLGRAAQPGGGEVAGERAGGGDRSGDGVGLDDLDARRRAPGGAAPGRASRRRCPTATRGSRPVASSARSRGAVAPSAVRGWRARARGPYVRSCRADISLRYIGCQYTHGRRGGRPVNERPRAGYPGGSERAIRRGPGSLVQWRRAPAHRLRAGPTGRPPRPSPRHGGPARRLRRPSRAAPGGPPRGRSRARTSARCARPATCAYVSYVYGENLRQANGRCIVHPSELERLGARTTSSPATWWRCAPTAGGTSSPAASCTAAGTARRPRLRHRPRVLGRGTDRAHRA